MIEFGKDSLIHLAVEQVCKNLVIYPFDELFLFGLVEPMFGEERIYVGFALGDVLVAGFGAGFHVREALAALGCCLFVCVIIGLTFWNGQFRRIELSGNSNLHRHTVRHVLDDLRELGVCLYYLHDRFVGRLVSGDFLVALCEVVVKGVFVVVLVGELPVGEFCSHILTNTRYAGSFRLLLICVFLSHFFTLILCVIDFDVKVSYLLIFKML